MSGRDDSQQGDPGSSKLFSEAMRDVTPLSARQEGRRERPPKARQSSSVAEVRATDFRIRTSGESLSGLARGVAARELRRLRGGRYPVELEVDLHGMTKVAARRTVRGALAKAISGGKRCVAIVHGRGSRSAGRPVLKEALPGWLAEPPHGSQVLAFTIARPERGGAGVTLVLLRRR